MYAACFYRKTLQKMRKTLQIICMVFTEGKKNEPIHRKRRMDTYLLVYERPMMPSFTQALVTETAR